MDQDNVQLERFIFRFRVQVNLPWMTYIMHIGLNILGNSSSPWISNRDSSDSVAIINVDDIVYFVAVSYCLQPSDNFSCLYSQFFFLDTGVI
jgi:hypothetical protein